MEIKTFSMSYIDIMEKEDGTKYGYMELEYFFLYSTVRILFYGENSYGRSGAHIKDIKDIDDRKDIVEFVNSISLRDDEEEVLLNIVNMFMGKVEGFKENK